MSFATKEKSLESALKIANKLRALLDLPPVDRLYPGDRSDASSCAITETVYDDDLDREKWRITTSTGAVQAWRNDKKDSLENYYTPVHSIDTRRVPGAATFVRRFDRGEFPELVKKLEEHA